MDIKAKIAVSAMGIMLLAGVIGSTISTLRLFKFAWGVADAASALGVIGYTVGAGVVSVILVGMVILFSVVGSVLTVCPWRGEETAL